MEPEAPEITPKPPSREMFIENLNRRQGEVAKRFDDLDKAITKPPEIPQPRREINPFLLSQLNEIKMIDVTQLTDAQLARSDEAKLSRNYYLKNTFHQPPTSPSIKIPLDSP
ncbi:MAG: hypothetical protein M3Q44_01375 [bacterium]|nr:hypothetical protein [bacterium]